MKKGDNLKKKDIKVRFEKNIILSKTFAILVFYFFAFLLTLQASTDYNAKVSSLLKQSPKKAIILSKKALEKSKNRNTRFIAYKNLGLAYYFTTEYDSALYYYDKALSISQKIKNKKEKADLLNNIGLCYINKNEFKKAFEYFNKALEISKKIDYKSGLADSYYNLGNLYWKTARYEKALKFYNDALKLYQKLNDEKSASSALNNIGNTYYKMKDYKTAVRFYLKSLTKKEKTGENPLSVLNNIAALYIKLGEYQKALHYLQKALFYCQKTDKKNLSLIYSNMGSIYLEINSDSTAIKYLKKALKLKQEFNDQKGISIVLNKIGSIYAKQNKLNKALENYSKSYQIRKNLPDNEGISNILFNMGILYMKLKDISKAKSYLLQAETIMKQNKDYENLVKLYLKLAELEKLRKNYKAALNYSNKVVALKDSVFKEKNEKQIRELLAKYETEKKEKQIELLSKNNKIKELQLSKQRTLLYTFIFGFVLISFLALYIWNLKQNELAAEKKIQNKIKNWNIELQMRVKEELKKIESQRQLLIQKSKLESLGKLAAGIAHEINQPLGGISMALENIYFSIIEKDENEKYYLEKLDDIKSYIKRISAIINHIRIFSRDQAVDKSEMFFAEEAIDNAISIIGTQYKKHKINIIKEFDKNRKKIKGNKFKLEQVILNLFTNAKDALEERKNSTDKYIKIITDYKDNICVIKIIDNGIGISQNIIDKIFDPFFTTKSPEKGTGLRLSIVYGIVKEMKGDIKVFSNQNQTEFKLVFPIQNS